jgi:hypothetical protein
MNEIRNVYAKHIIQRLDYKQSVRKYEDTIQYQFQLFPQNLNQCDQV